jgi:hypothetical protein
MDVIREPVAGAGLVAVAAADADFAGRRGVRSIFTVIALGSATVCWTWLLNLLLALFRALPMLEPAFTVAVAELLFSRTDSAAACG